MIQLVHKLIAMYCHGHRRNKKYRHINYNSKAYLIELESIFGMLQTKHNKYNLIS